MLAEFIENTLICIKSTGFKRAIYRNRGGGHAVAQLVGALHSRKVAGSIPDDESGLTELLTGIFRGK